MMGPEEGQVTVCRRRIRSIGGTTIRMIGGGHEKSHPGSSVSLGPSGHGISHVGCPNVAVPCATRMVPPRTARLSQQRFQAILLLLLGRCCLGQQVGQPTNAPFIRGPVIVLEPVAPPTVQPIIEAPSVRPSTGSLRTSLRPTTSPSVPFAPPTDALTVRPTVTKQPSLVPSERPTSLPPSPAPTVSDQPSTTPTTSPMPSISPQPSHEPSSEPTGMPTRTPTIPPTMAPTLSPQPSHLPSISPSSDPTTSTAPSSKPSISMQPSTSTAPSAIPSVNPTASNRPSQFPTTTPTMLPSSSPSTPFPTLFPTPSLRLVRQPRLSMILWGMDRDVRTFDPTIWEAITSRHVQLYWRTFDRDIALFYVGRVTTTLIREERISASSGRRGLQGNFTRVMSSPLRVVYSQEIEYDIRMNVTDEDIPSFFSEEDLFTLPFEQDALSYTIALATELRNNTNVIFLDFIGLIESPRDANSDRERRILTTIIAVVVTSICVAGGVIAYLTRSREHHVVNENYEDEHRSPMSSATRKDPTRASPGDVSTPSGSVPPMQEVRGDASSPNVATTISDIGSTGDAADRYKSGQSVGSIHSVTQSTGGPASPFDDLSPTREHVDEYHDDSTTNTNDVDDSTAGRSAPIPFMADFQMEIKDLE